MKSTTKSTAEFINEQIAINEEIRELKVKIERSKKLQPYTLAFAVLSNIILVGWICYV